MPTQINSSCIDVLCGCSDFSELVSVYPQEPFSAQICNFLHKVSQIIREMPEARSYPDVLTYGFFCRKANLQRLCDRYGHQLEGRVGRGVTFHIAPSNVPINFAYTLTAGLLAGNICIVKASSKDFPQTRIVCNAYKKALAAEEFKNLQPFVNVVIYDRSEERVTEYFSNICNFRVIWGGNETVSRVRKIALPPRALEMTFADRYSLAVIDAKSVLNTPDLSHLAHEFYNDTYLYDQNACSSPRLIYWLGEDKQIHTAQERFWMAVLDEIKDIYPVQAVNAVDKQMTICRAAIDLGGVRKIEMPDNRISRIQMDELAPHILDYRCAGGSFLEYSDVTLDALASIVTETFQTIAYYGCSPEELKRWVINKGLRGIDRIVPIGKTADWDLIWDGTDLLLAMSRVVAAL